MRGVRRHEEVVGRELDALVRPSTRKREPLQVRRGRLESRRDPASHEVQRIGAVPPRADDGRIVPRLRRAPEAVLQGRHEVVLEDRFDAGSRPRERPIRQGPVHRRAAVRLDEPPDPPPHPTPPAPAAHPPPRTPHPLAPPAPTTRHPPHPPPPAPLTRRTAPPRP